MRTVDILLAFPGILLAIALAGVLGPSLWNIVLALSVLGWVGYARIVRAQFLTLREREYVVAARALGAGSLRIIGRHLLPNSLSPVIVQATFSAAGVIIAESSLSFLGLGPQEIPTWGGTLSWPCACLRRSSAYWAQACPSLPCFRRRPLSSWPTRFAPRTR